MGSWLGDFFGALPDAFLRLYQFGDPNGKGDGWWGFLIAGIWAVGLTAIPLFIARRTHGTHEWVSATMGVLGATAIFFWIYGVIPSAWVYFVDSNKDVLEHAIIPSTMVPNIGDRELKIADNLYVVIRDSVVVVEHLIALGATFWAALAIQKRFPRTYAPGEEKRESGGYH